MNTKYWISFLFLLAIGIPLSQAQDKLCTFCMPVSTVHNIELFNPCAGAQPSNYCNDVIRKTTQHTILWPDGKLEQAWLTAYGHSSCAASCMKDWIGAPWFHRDCWPEFYTPISSTRNYYAGAYDNSTDVILRWCAAMAYVWAVFCTGPTGAYHYISIDHRCLDCYLSDDADQDGYIAPEAGGDDCNDRNFLIHPGADPICYFGYDANCNGIQDYIECATSPIVIDLGKDGIALTDKDGGVQFDLNADGTKEQLSWTTAEADDAWLCLDRNGNGTIDDGQELFGSATPQPEPPRGSEPNGFAALAVFDTPASGGNGNGMIDAEDSIYAKLLLWRDSNHNGISEPEELKPLSSYGIAAINLDYKLSRKSDEYGNQFRYRTKVTVRNSTIGKWAWDVFLVR
jgi:hypothetical protein